MPPAIRSTIRLMRILSTLWLVPSLWLLPSAVPAGTTPGDGPRIEIHATAERPDLMTVEVSGLSRRRALEWQSLDARALGRLVRIVAFDPQAAGTPADELPNLLGRFSWRQVDGADLLHFQPSFPVAPGLELLAWVEGSAAEARRQSPELDRPPSTRVRAVFPADEGDGPVRIPSNLLRMYVYFSSSMAARGVPDAVSLVDEEGQPVPVAFVGVPGGLWDPERRRLTLLVHPGRVKRGVGPEREMGGVLRQGERYRLRIGTRATDADGLPLAEPFEQVFEVGPPDYRSPEPEAWRILLPKSSQGALSVELPQPADVALLSRLPTVVDAKGEPVEGRIEVDPSASAFRFFPLEPWSPGAYRLVVPPELEDPSGNRPGRRFEEPVGGSSSETAHRLPFVIP